MPVFHYSAVDSTGRPRQGQIQAQNAGEALRSLMSQGLQSPKILAEGPGSAAARRTQGPQQGIQQAPVQQAPVQSSRPGAQTVPGKLQINMPAAPVAPQVHYTKRSSDRDLYFLFTQIAEQL